MDVKKTVMVVAMLVGGLQGNAFGVDPLPDDFPGIIVTVYNPDAVGEGYIFLTQGTGDAKYVMMLDNDGTPVWYQKELSSSFDFKVQPNGYMSFGREITQLTYTGGSEVIHVIQDESYNEIELISAGNGYINESHDFQLLPNGNVLQLGYYLNEMDMSRIVNGGHPGALVSGVVVQELDTNRNVVFQWRTWDYFSFDEFPFESYKKARSSIVHAGELLHANDLNQDFDGHLILGTPRDVIKINRQSGEVMWHLGGSYNEFTLTNPPDADFGHFGGHATYRIANGNFLMYDNAPRNGKGTSQVHEYFLDEVNKTATHIWSYVPPAAIQGINRGNAQRLPNGNTFIGWGGSNEHIPACSEVTPDGEVVFELFFEDADDKLVSYRAFRFPYPPASQSLSYREFELAQGNEYDFGDTGVNIDIDTFNGEGYNDVTVTREPYAPVYPGFASAKAPRLLPVRVEMDAYGINSMTAEISFDAESFGFDEPESLTIYHRSYPGQGLFFALADTNFNPVTRQLRGTMTEFGEFVFGYPDVADVPYEPILNRVENYRGVQEVMAVHPRKAEADTIYSVNQELPVLLSWSPKGFARSYEFQLATDSEFTALVVDRSWMTDGFHVFEDAQPDTSYYYRVKTRNEGGVSEWAVGSFMTIAPAIEVTSPGEGDSWQEGLEYFIKWNDNIAEDVVIELYKADVKVQEIVIVASDRVFEWELPLEGLEGGCDYSIKIKSSVDDAVFDISEVFSIGVAAADFDCDGCVGFDDLEVLAGQWLNEQSGLGADADDDGRVDADDFAVLARDWMKGCP